jgi:predicted nucleic acid-binding protein
VKYLVDSDWVADWLKGKQAAITLVSSFARGDVAISLLTYGEIYEGIYYGRDAKRHERAFTQFLRGVQVVPFSQPIMRRFARIRGDLRRKGRLIPDADLLIAATALHHNLSLVSRNVRDFQRVPGLLLYSIK